MSKDWLDSVVLITSSNPEIQDFGTGFVIFRDEQATYVLTCAHVVNAVGGPASVKLGGILATVIASGSEDDIDLAVLCVSGLSDRLPLRLGLSGEKDKYFETAGFQWSNKQFLFRELEGIFGEQIRVGITQDKLIKAWDLKITTKDYQLQRGNSGSPVVDKSSGNVVAIVYVREGDGKKGRAISVETLKKIWQKLPSDIFTQETEPHSPADQSADVAYNEYEHYERDLHRQLNEARLRSSQSIFSLPSPYKIDKNFFIQFNLNRQRAKFLELLGDEYNGAFALAVTSDANDILREYILERMVLELKQRNDRSSICYHIFLNNNDIRGGEQAIERKILALLELNQITDLFGDNVHTDVILVIWHDTCLTKFVKMPAFSFYERLKEQIEGLLCRQNRCLLLFWATIGKPPIHPKIALPPLENFDVEKLAQWLAERLQKQLQDQGMADNLIEGYLDALKREIAKWEGHPIHTYEIIQKLA